MSGTGRREFDGVVVGSGPNGLAAAVMLARAGWRVLVVEGADHLGGGLRTLPLIEPGVAHDTCSATHPLALASPFFREWGLEARVEMLNPDVPFAHALDGGRFGVAYRDVQATADRLAQVAPGDGEAYRRLIGPLVDSSGPITELFTSRLRGLALRPPSLRGTSRLAPRVLARMPGIAAAFSRAEGPALIAGNAAHAVRPLGGLAPAAVGLLLTTLAHSVGWPVPRGGSGAIAGALVADIRAHGGEFVTGTWVRDLDDLPPARATLLDLDPRQVVALAGERMHGAAGSWYRAWGSRYRFGSGACTVHYVTTDAIPWLDPEARRAGTVHVGGPWTEVARAEATVAAGRHGRRPFTLVGQPTVVDPARGGRDNGSRRGGGRRHVVWAYCHVPHGSPVDATDAVTAQIERFAPGFRDTVIGTSTRTATQLAAENPLHVGGDIAVGVPSVLGTALRPVPRWDAYRTPAPGVYVCSSATPPGPGVHGMGGYWAAKAAIADHGDLTSDRR